MKIFMIGPFPPPIHGMSLANRTLYEGLKDKNDICILDTNTEKGFGDLKDQGTFTSAKIFRSIGQVLPRVFKILFSEKFDIVYITSSQNAVGCEKAGNLYGRKFYPEFVDFTKCFSKNSRGVLICLKKKF